MRVLYFLAGVSLVLGITDSSVDKSLHHEASPENLSVNMIEAAASAAALVALLEERSNRGRSTDSSFERALAGKAGNCEGHNCDNNSPCVATEDGYTCTCNPEHYGDYCDLT